MGYITQTKDYWIAPNAVNITLNALGDANRIQGSVASGAVIMCYLADIKPARMGEEYAKNGDGLLYTNGHEYKTWPLSLSPTYFNSFTHKYVYCAIPRSVSVGSQAVIVFPSEQIDIYGCAERVTVDPETGETVTDEEGNPVMHDEQIGSEDYFYVYLQGIIGSSGESGTTLREWEDPIGLDEWGTLDTAGGRDSRVNDAEWYRYDLTTQLVTFLKNITMKDGTSFLKLFAEDAQIKIIKGIQQLVFSSNSGTPITGVATKANADAIPENSTQHIVTPSYLDEFGNTRYLSKIHDDTAAGIITFLQGIKFGSPDSAYGFDGNGAGRLLSLIFDRYIASLGAAKGFNHGHGIYMDALEGLIETDGLNVRGFMRVMELIINRLQLMESDYSFTEGDTIEHVDYYTDPTTGAPDGTLLLTMKKDHENDFTPFYPGDIIYGIKNDLLPKDGTVPDGHSVTRSGASYFHTWMRVISVNLTDNQLRVALYQGRRYKGQDEQENPLYEAIVPGGTNFTPYGTPITTDASGPVTEEFLVVPGDDPTQMPSLGVTGYDTMLTVTRHGNVADGIDPETGEYDEHILQSQLGRQQAWVLSTTDRNLTFYWNVNKPIVDKYNYALSLGILPGAIQEHLGGDKSTADFTKPSLWVDTIFYDHSHRANFPAKIVYQDRGQWTALPTAEYDGIAEGIYTPDGTLTNDWTTAQPTSINSDVSATFRTAVESWRSKMGLTPGQSDEYVRGDVINEPYHYRTFTKATWLAYRLDTAAYPLTGSNAVSDKQLLAKLLYEAKVDLEVSRVWNHGIIWECLVDGTTQEPCWGCTDWIAVGGDTVYYCEITSSAGTTFRNGNVSTVLTMEVRYGQEVITDRLAAQPGAAIVWGRSTQWNPTTRRFEPTSEDEAWTATPVPGEPYSIQLERSDLGSGWMTDYRQALIHCSIYAPDADGSTEEYPADFITSI